MCLWFCESHDVCISLLLVTKLSHLVLLPQVSQGFVLSSLASLEIAKSRFHHCHFTLSPHVKKKPIEIFTWTINVLVHILILHYLIYLNKGSWAGFQSLHASSNPSLFCFHFNKADFIYLQLVDSWVCPPWPNPHCAALCGCLLPRVGCVAFIPSPWLSPGSSDTCSWERRALGLGALWPLLPGQAGPRLVWPGSCETEGHHGFCICPWLYIFCVLLHLRLQASGMAVVEFVEDFSPGKPWIQAIFCGDTCLLSAGEIFHSADLLWAFVMGFLAWCL